MCAVKIMLADISEVWMDALEDQLKHRHEVRRCCNGTDVIPQLLEYQPDLLVLELMMPGMDGLTILRTIRTCGLPIRLLITSRVFSPYVMDVLRSFNISYALQKPCTVCAAVSHINEMIRSDDFKADTDELDTLLLMLGFRMSLTGYRCLYEAIRLMQENPRQSITKELYPAIARKCGGTPQRVERAIRNVIRDAWQRRDEHLWCAYLPRNREGKITLPSNGEWIARLAAYMVRADKAC